MKNIKQYYKELGKLVYAVAAADGMVQAEERNELHQFVLKEMAYNEHSVDSSGMNQAFYVDFEFDVAEENHLSSGQILNAFIKFVQSNIEPHDDVLIGNSLKLLERVSVAYSKHNEKSIIESVRQELLKISSNIPNVIK